jgi:hypothetical protein
MPDVIIIPMLLFESKYLMPKFHGEQFYSINDWTRCWNRETDFAKVGIASWQAWASRNNVILNIATELPSPDACGYTESQIEELKKFPPTISRWLLPLAARRKYGLDSYIAMIDADTLVSPDAPSIFKQAHEGVILAQDQSGWNQWKEGSLLAFGSMFPGFNFDKSKYFNAGVIVLENDKLPTAFLNFTLQYSKKFLSLIDGTVGTDQTVLNFILQALVSNNELTVAFLDSKWNAKIADLLLEVEKLSSQHSILSVVSELVQQNYISHFTVVKLLMPAVWQFLKRGGSRPLTSVEDVLRSAGALQGVAYAR